MTEEKIAEELVQFLRSADQPQLKKAAMKNVLGLTCSGSGIKFILKHRDLLEAILSSTKSGIEAFSSDAYDAFVNLAADEEATQVLLSDYDIITDQIRTICDATSKMADKSCQVMGNISRDSEGSLAFLKACMEKYDTDSKKREKNSKISEIFDIFCKPGYNVTGATLDHIASILTNITQTKEGRAILLSHDNPAIGRILPFLKPDSSIIRRRGVSMAIKNCCFEHEHHEWLLSDEIEILPHLLLPLAGNEELKDHENDDLPLDLQYLPEDKTREPDPEIRMTLLETLLLLCADTPGRKFLKDSGTYYIIRELHSWEMENGPEENNEQCEKLIQILIGDEPEPGMENLMKIPEEKLKPVSEQLG